MLIFDPAPYVPPGGVNLQQSQTHNYWLSKIFPQWLPKEPQNGKKKSKINIFMLILPILDQFGAL